MQNSKYTHDGHLPKGTTMSLARLPVSPSTAMQITDKTTEVTLLFISLALGFL
jgi:hypothetical protein